MYGHALDLLPQCAVESCKRPGLIQLDDGRIFCAADALTTNQI